MKDRHYTIGLDLREPQGKDESLYDIKMESIFMDLKPCPCCGEPAAMESSNAIECTDKEGCGINLIDDSGNLTEEELTARWNRRQ